ncbi:MAG: membrane protein [Betaproteobacteria bacterium]|nr:MAG: membrane protein [Betaproteobacteria bacterium]
MRKTLLLALACLALLGGQVQAGQTCSENPPTAETLQKAFRLALKTRDALEASGAEVALIARVGQDLSKYRLRYSHLGFAWRDHPQGRWLVVHMLNQCGTANSDLFNEGLANFFLDDLFAWEGLVVVPGAEMQKKIAASLREGHFVRLHEPSYNMLAYPFSARYQNSNQWALEVMADATGPGPLSGRVEAQQWLKANGYAPTTLEIPAMTRLGGRMFRANIAFDDHPSERRWAGQIDTVTVESVFAFVASRDPANKRVLVRLDQ